jgi:hypothetical protein
MSVSKFCEVTSALTYYETHLHPFGRFSLVKCLFAVMFQHSGLCDVNPGDAVHMDSGETIAQWRKLYFQKFEVRCTKHFSGCFYMQACAHVDKMYLFKHLSVHARICMLHVCVYADEYAP